MKKQPRIFALEQSHDPEGKSIEIALYNQDFTKNHTLRVSKETLKHLKTLARYVWTDWYRIPGDHLKAVEVDTEEQLFS